MTLLYYLELCLAAMLPQLVALIQARRQVWRGCPLELMIFITHALWNFLLVGVMESPQQMNFSNYAVFGGKERLSWWGWG